MVEKAVVGTAMAVAVEGEVIEAEAARREVVEEGETCGRYTHSFEIGTVSLVGKEAQASRLCMHGFRCAPDRPGGTTARRDTIRGHFHSS